MSLQFWEHLLVFVIQQGSRCLETKEEQPNLGDLLSLISALRFSLEIGPAS